MSFIRRLRDRAAEAQQHRAEERAVREAQQAAERAEREAIEAEERRQRAAAQAAADEAERMRYAEQVFGPELAHLEVNTPEEAKYAIKLAKLRKRQIQGEKRELAAELADERERWRGRQAGRISTVGLGRGTGGRIIRAGIQANRRSERLEHAGRVNQYSDVRQDLDRQIALIDRFIIELERQAARKA